MGLVVIVLLAAGLRLYDISLESLQADENVSWDAARGILHTGLPHSASGIFYTRSPLYHYLLGAWLGLFGDQLEVARAFASLSGLGAIVVSYLIMLNITGRHTLALLTAFILAIDPWQIHMSRIVRFYQQTQLFSLLSTLFFLKGFLWREGRHWQYLFFVSCAAAVLSQEVFITTFPAFFVAFLACYRPFDWKNDWRILLGTGTVVVVLFIDLAIFYFWCLTPLVAISTSTGSITQLHLFNVTIFSNTALLGNNNANLLYSSTALLGLLYWVKKPQAPILVLYSLVGLTIIMLTVLVVQSASRYIFPLYPFIVMLSILTIDAVLQTSANDFFPGALESLQGTKKRWIGLMAAIIGSIVLCNMEPWKTVFAYGHPLNLEHQEGFEYIRQHKQDRDKIMSVHPMTAAILFGGIDYYLANPISFDEVYSVERGIIERWAGGKLISKIDQIRELFHQHQRLWIMLDELETLKMPPEILDFLARSTTVEYELFGVKILLWDHAAGRYTTAIDQGGAGDSY
jgi:4-amino-4-deoxy-L-arabinose transferase-like glycosyltransferase